MARHWFPSMLFITPAACCQQDQHFYWIVRLLDRDVNKKTQDSHVLASK